jgi:hypothetical protein
MSFLKLSKLLDKKIKKKGSPNLFLCSLVCYQALKSGEGLFEPISFKDGTLLVRVSDSSSASTVQLSQAQIIEKINQKLGQEVVKKIRIKIFH